MSDYEKQEQKIFFNFNGKKKSQPPRPTEEDIRKLLRSDDCPLNQIIVKQGSTANGGNSDNFDLLFDAAFQAHKRFNHSLSGMNFGVYGKSGCGKTYVVQKFVDSIGIPFIFIQSKSLDSTYTLLMEMMKKFKAFQTPLVLTGEDQYRIPPCVVFFDEAHALKDALVESALLNPMDAGDSTMYCQARKNAPIITADVKEVCWIAATTDKAKLFDAFRTRLTEIEWQSAGPDELKYMVRMAMDKEYASNKLPFQIPLDACELVYKFEPVPREANAFARQMIFRKDRVNCSWEEACEEVRKARGYDEYGLHFRQLAILKALGQHPIAKGNLNAVARCRQEEVDNDHLPSLMEYRDDRPWCISTSRGVAITRNGLKQLVKRGIMHKGEKVTAEGILAKAA
jgi:Holliday junction resolvasome RuvABC ATP-dependent DNA helicase subunit